MEYRALLLYLSALDARGQKISRTRAIAPIRCNAENMYILHNLPIFLDTGIREKERDGRKEKEGGKRKTRSRVADGAVRPPQQRRRVHCKKGGAGEGQVLAIDRREVVVLSRGTPGPCPMPRATAACATARTSVSAAPLAPSSLFLGLASASLRESQETPEWKRRRRGGAPPFLVRRRSCNGHATRANLLYMHARIASTRTACARGVHIRGGSDEDKGSRRAAAGAFFKRETSFLKFVLEPRECVRQGEKGLG